MTDIITIEDGTRFRKVKAHNPVVNYEQLPRVSEWPLPGAAPQYLAKNPRLSQLQKGDLLLTVTPNVRIWKMHRNFNSNTQKDKQWYGYLIARADPGVDF